MARGSLSFHHDLRCCKWRCRRKGAHHICQTPGQNSFFDQGFLCGVPSDSMRAHHNNRSLTRRVKHNTAFTSPSPKPAVLVFCTCRRPSYSGCTETVFNTIETVLCWSLLRTGNNVISRNHVFHGLDGEEFTAPSSSVYRERS